MLPPTVALFHTLNDARKASQLVANSGAARQSSGAAKAYRSAHGAHGADLEAVVGGSQGVPAERNQVDEAAQVGLLVGEQPRSARQPGVALAPVAARLLGWPSNDLGDGVYVHVNDPSTQDGLEVGVRNSDVADCSHSLATNAVIDGYPGICQVTSALGRRCRAWLTSIVGDSFLAARGWSAAAVLGESCLTACRSAPIEQRLRAALHYASASDVTAGIVDGSFDARQVATQTLDAARRHQPAPQRGGGVARDEMLTAADELDHDDARGPLAGVPVTIKDAIDVSGLPTTWGNPEWENNVAATDAEVVKRLRATGALDRGQNQRRVDARRCRGVKQSVVWPDPKPMEHRSCHRGIERGQRGGGCRGPFVSRHRLGSRRLDPDSRCHVRCLRIETNSRGGATGRLPSARRVGCAIAQRCCRAGPDCPQRQ